MHSTERPKGSVVHIQTAVLRHGRFAVLIILLTRQPKDWLGGSQVSQHVLILLQARLPNLRHMIERIGPADLVDKLLL
jgi:hypothetical protein